MQLVIAIAALVAVAGCGGGSRNYSVSEVEAAFRSEGFGPFKSVEYQEGSVKSTSLGAKGGPLILVLATKDQAAQEAEAFEKAAKATDQRVTLSLQRANVLVESTLDASADVRKRVDAALAKLNGG